MSSDTTGTPATGQEPYCGTTEAAVQADACCAPAAKTEAVAQGADCCAPSADAQTADAGGCAVALQIAALTEQPGALPNVAGLISLASAAGDACCS